MKQNFEYRNAAWDMLKADWQGPVLLFFFYNIVVMLMSTVLGLIFGGSEVLSSLVSLAVEVFIAFPVAYLCLKEYVKYVRGGKIVISKDLVEPFKADYVRAIKVFGLSTVYTMLWMLLLIIPGVIKSYAYCMAPYINMNNENLTAEECINQSMKLTDGYKMKLFLLDLSFIGWYLLGFITLGVGLLWIVPYHYVARIMMFEDIMNAQAQVQAQAIEE